MSYEKVGNTSLLFSKGHSQRQGGCETNGSWWEGRSRGGMVSIHLIKYHDPLLESLGVVVLHIVLVVP